MFHFSATFRKNTVRCLALALLLSAAALTPALAAVPQTAAMQESSRSAAQSGGPEKQAPLSAGKTQSSPSQAAPKTGPARTLPQAPKKQSVPPKDSGITLTISAAGDCTLGTDENFGYDGTFAAAYDAADWDASVFLKGVEPVFRNDDLTIVNLEGPLSEGGVRQEKTFAFRGPSHYVNVLTAGSVEAATLANNHSYDYGEDAYWDTFRTLGEAGVMPFGYEESQILSVKGIPVGLAGINDLAGGAEEQLLTELQKLKAEGAQLLVVYFHWGTELAAVPDPDQVYLAHLAIDSGADLVLGAHPHVLQGVETYKGKKICYSLGNFCFGGNSNPSDKDTMIFQQTFTFRDGSLAGSDAGRIIPCRISSTPDCNDYRPTILTGAEAERVLAKIAGCLPGTEQEGPVSDPEDKP